MSVRSITRDTWTRVFVDAAEDFDTAERVLANRMRGGDSEHETRLQLSIVAAANGSVHVYELTVILFSDQIITIEPGAGVPLLQDVEAQLQWADDTAGSPHHAWFAIAQAGFQSNAAALAFVEADINAVRAPMAKAARSGSSRSLGVSDLPRVTEMLVDVDHSLSYIASSIAALTQLARLLRRESVLSNPGVARPQVDALVQQGEALTRRVEFMVDRHRFLSQGASQQISTSDLNIVKIFTVLWAILIPGTTLINWYGQNFEVMPELSWEYSSWVQILGVFFLAVIPIYTVKRAGQLR
ncbi:CorA family divalent cation transporter [Leucobacter komagatae]|uniref:CorA family divalent cation transporter n=1 Tax=Leucobacter komagatae TaxID=55969 RepID=UPI000A840E26|nr:CorA family divalent cation transporter [Leucobacter komagatae]